MGRSAGVGWSADGPAGTHRRTVPVPLVGMALALIAAASAIAALSASPTLPSAGATTATTASPLLLTAGELHTCAVFDATLKCWGANSSGQLGQGDQAPRGDDPDEMGDDLPPVDLGAGHVVTSIDAGGNHTCAILDDAALKCWGDNDNGQLGIGTGDGRDWGVDPTDMGDGLPAVDLGTGRHAVAVSAGVNHTCAILDDGSLKCWGDNEQGQLGLGDRRDRDHPRDMGDRLPTVDLGTARTATAVAAGTHHTCVILDDGAVKCWGDGWRGQLGLGDDIDRGDQPGEMGDALPTVDLGTGRTAAALSTGSFAGQNCAILDDATVRCWGYNAFGELGLGDHDNRGDGPGDMGDDLPPVELGTGRTAVAVASATRGEHSCAVLDDGTVKCWGDNDSGQLGQGDRDTRGDEPAEMGDHLPAVLVGAGRTVAAVSAGTDHTCVALDDDSVRCWGHNASGQLGLGDTAARGGQPGEMGDALPTVDLGAPAGHQPDLTVRVPGGPLVGDDVHTNDATRQTVRVDRHPGGQATVYVRVQNDGSVADRFVVGGSSTQGDKLRVRYFVGRSDVRITGAITNRTFTTPRLEPGARFTIAMQIDLTSSAPRGLVTDLVLRAQPRAAPAKDAVRIRVRVT